MELLNGQFFSTVIGAIIGFAGSILGGLFANKQLYNNRKRYAASVLLNDLMSIERYLVHERSAVNLRYTDNWQNYVSDCSFLKDEDLKLIYLIYDEVYNYNYRYNRLEQQGPFRNEDICSYANLKCKMFDATKGIPDMNKHSKEYERLIRNLKKASR